MTFVNDEQYVKPVYRTDAQIALSTIKGLCIGVTVLGILSGTLAMVLAR